MCAGVDDTLAVILAGGAGTRVGGEDKGLLPLSGRSLIEHALARLRPQCDRVLIVANRHADDYAGHAPVIHDTTPGHAGPLAGLLAAFGFAIANRHALPRWLLTVPVDCPDPPAHLAASLQDALAAQDDARCAYAVVQGRRQPLFALYRVGAAADEWHASVQAALTAHGSPWRWHDALDALAVNFDDAGRAFHNLNSPADFAEYENTHASN